MSNNRVGRRIKHRHAEERLAEQLAQRVDEVLALARERDGCTCDPCVIPPWETETGRWALEHTHGCPVVGLVHDHDAECPECKREAEERGE